MVSFYLCPCVNEKVDIHVLHCFHPLNNWRYFQTRKLRKKNHKGEIIPEELGNRQPQQAMQSQQRTYKGQQSE